jgi:Ca-activated chloride channel family protein
MRTRIIPAFLVFVALAGVFYAQTPGRQNRGTQIDINVVSVPLMVSVTDSKGKLITNLKKEDFRVYEDDKLQTIRSFTRESDLPLSIALLVDSSGSVIDKLKFEKDAATDFFFSTIKRRKDRAAVISFNSDVRLITDDTPDGFTDQPERLSEALRKIQAAGETAVFDAVHKATASKLAHEQGERRRLIVLISDGEDTASKFSQTEALEMAQRHDVTIYAISTNKTSDLKSRAQQKGDEVIQLLADETGGRAYFPLKLEDLAADFQKIGEELRSQYVLSYTPSNSEQDGAYRKIRVEMVNDNYKPRARKGYFTDKK